jgi:hypothetical protein
MEGICSRGMSWGVVWRSDRGSGHCRRASGAAEGMVEPEMSRGPEVEVEIGVGGGGYVEGARKVAAFLAREEVEAVLTLARCAGWMSSASMAVGIGGRVLSILVVSVCSSGVFGRRVDSGVLGRG